METASLLNEEQAAAVDALLRRPPGAWGPDVVHIEPGHEPESRLVLLDDGKAFMLDASGGITPMAVEPFPRYPPCDWLLGAA